uniref:NADH dehydrogenase subunit 6 n=1 Tax=Hydropsyche pellucidula TaxID=869943 RepID=A0A0U3DY37_9NEOP|nr:NADH dehydrogenase subunit 6 [Hydropsyche pellucidula]ALT58526.1 NADH dehydrogenase subunit 6 [Hydropsyche pellucidula]
MKMFFLILFIYITLIMFFIKNPLNMGLSILTQTLIMCLMLNFNMNFYWLSYILYLIMLGGILILFMYMCSIASNEIIKFNLNLFFFFLFMLFMYMIFIQFNWMWIYINPINLNNLNYFFSMENLSMTKIYNNYSMYMSIFLVIYLFILLLMVTMMTNTNKGPLRMFLS